MAELTPVLMPQLAAYPGTLSRTAVLAASPAGGDSDAYKLTMEAVLYAIHWGWALRARAADSGSPATPIAGVGTVNTVTDTLLIVSAQQDADDIQPGALLSVEGETVRVLSVNSQTRELTVDPAVTWTGPNAFTYLNMLSSASTSTDYDTERVLKGYINHNGHYVSINQSGVAISQNTQSAQVISGGVQVIGWGDGLQPEDWNPLGEWDSVDQTFRPAFTGVYQVSYILPWYRDDPVAGDNVQSWIQEKPVGTSSPWVRMQISMIPLTGRHYGVLMGNALMRLDKTKAYQLSVLLLATAGDVVLPAGESRHLSFRGIAELT